MKILFLALTLIGSAILAIYYNKKILFLKHQLRILNKTSPKTNRNIRLTFFVPNSRGGIIKENSRVLISPLSQSQTLHKAKIKMEVYIIDMAKDYNNTWYYVSLPLDNNINSRGWVKSTDFSIMYSNSNSVSTNTK